MSNLLALDQAINTTGWAVFQNEELIQQGKFTTKADESGEKLLQIRNEIISLINQYEIDEVVFENIQLQGNVYNNVDTFKKLAEVYGVLEELFTELRISYSSVLASSWKSTLGIKGKDRAAQKRAAQQWVIDTYEIKPTQDVCDAICIGAHYIKKNKSAF